jgi:uncharacterized membrane protein
MATLVVTTLKIFSNSLEKSNFSHCILEYAKLLVYFLLVFDRGPK